MSNKQEHFHGSDLEKIEQTYKIPKEQIISFSGNVNPLGISPRLKQTLADQIEVISSYPDREYTALRKALSRYTGISPDLITVGNGTSELISLFIQTLKPKKALIVGPTYSEYQREVTRSGGDVSYFPLAERDDFKLDPARLYDALVKDISLLILCNPNNPTSTIVSADLMKAILDYCKDKNIMVLVDETYIEFVDDINLVSAVPLAADYDNITILRGVSKFFAAPGLRLGYAVTGSQDLLKKVNDVKIPWTLNSLASAAGEIMFEDREYIRQTRELISGERSRLYNHLQEWNTIKVYKPQANFLLIQILREDLTAHDVFEHAIKNQMMIRDCASFAFLDQQYFRICFLKPEQNNQLLQCLEGILL